MRVLVRASAMEAATAGSYCQIANRSIVDMFELKPRIQKLVTISQNIK